MAAFGATLIEANSVHTGHLGAGVVLEGGGKGREFASTWHLYWRLASNQISIEGQLWNIQIKDLGPNIHDSLQATA